MWRGEEKGNGVQAELRNVLLRPRFRISRNRRKKKKKKVLTFITALANHLMEKVKEAFVNTPQPKNSSTQSAEVFMPPPSQLSGTK